MAIIQAKLDVTVLTPEKKVAHLQAEMLIAPASEGEVGILPAHRSFLTTLGPGTVECREVASEVTSGEASASRRFQITGGFLEVQNDRVVILAEQIL